MIIEPTVGRIVWFWEQDKAYQAQPCAAIVTYVHDTRHVNLMVFTHSGEVRFHSWISLMQEGDPEPKSYFAEWMPYQIGQAKKHTETP